MLTENVGWMLHLIYSLAIFAFCIQYLYIHNYVDNISYLATSDTNYAPTLDIVYPHNTYLPEYQNNYVLT